MNKETFEQVITGYAASAKPSFVTGEFDRYAIAQAFEEGAQWRINSVWHDASEEPKNENVSILIEYSTCGIDGFCYMVCDDILDYDIQRHVTYCTVIRWAYIDDLLPEKKEGWVNVYYDNDASSHRGCRFIYDTKEEAIKGAGASYIATIKISWEEQTMWIARDADKTLWGYPIKPEKDKELNRWIVPDNCSIQNAGFLIPSNLFPEVKWSDEEPRELFLKPIKEETE